MNIALSRTAALTVAVALTSLGSVSGAQAKSPRVTETQMCGSIATKLKVSAEDAGVEVEYELDQNVNGKTWALTLKRNGTVAGSAKRTTRAPSGSLNWRVMPSDASGGTFTVTAKNGSKTCTISATL